MRVVLHAENRGCLADSPFNRESLSRSFFAMETLALHQLCFIYGFFINCIRGLAWYLGDVKFTWFSFLPGLLGSGLSFV